MNARKINQFEKLAWECEIRAKPGDKNQSLAFTDWLVDRGFTLMGAKRHVTMLVREGTEEIQRQRVEKLLGENSNDASRARRAIRMAAGVSRDCQFTIEVVAGGQSPERVGDLGYYVDLGGQHITIDTEWSGNVAELEWVDGPLRIVAGAAWVLNAVQDMPAYLVI